ncbi:hypothetical protein MC7420_1882 [Coleofasciculus chthonoplastes PCC 7420]|uniref:Uncharacterized protein n=1 Tax=Coleofasciculus chthonoplastes PCC 7420 TaxID=118168 RepID=B4VM98_9CYAN|nr:hypothetical protein MC7420_1882 [Coleofasciculus chthonoplastes PCC 7420]
MTQVRWSQSQLLTSPRYPLFKLTVGSVTVRNLLLQMDLLTHGRSLSPSNQRL